MASWKDKAVPVDAGPAWKKKAVPVTDPAAAVGAAVRGAAPETAALSKIEEVMSPGAFGEAVAHGASFGFSDEISSALASLSGRDYDTELQASRDRMDAYRERDPVAAFAGELLGGVAVPGLSAARVARALPWLGKVGSLAAAGAVGGGVSGFGMGEGGLENRLGSGALGAGVGAVAAPALVGLANVGKNGVDAFLDVTGLGGAGRADTLANRKILQSFERMDMGVDDAGRAIDDLRAAGIPNAALADLGQPASRLTAAASRIPGEGAEIASDFVEARQASQGSGMVSFFEDLLQTNKTGASFLDDLNSTQKLAAKPLYDQALQSQAVVDTAPLLARISDDLQDAVGPEQAALKRVASFLVRQADDGSIVPKTDIAALHKVKIGIDGLIENAGTDSAIGRAGRRTLAQLKAELLSLMDAAEPGYAAARAKWAGAMELEDALSAGREVFKTAPEELLGVYKGLNQSQQPAFRIGLIDAIKDAVGRAGDGRNKVLTLFGNPRIRAQFEAVLGPDEFQRVVKFMGAGRVVSKTGAEIAGNSKTAQRQLDDADFTQDPMQLLNVLKPSNWLQGLGRKMTGYTKGMNEKTAASVVGKMTEMDPQKIAGILKVLEDFRLADLRRAANPLRSGATYGAGLATAIQGLLN